MLFYEENLQFARTAVFEKKPTGNYGDLIPPIPSTVIFWKVSIFYQEIKNFSRSKIHIKLLKWHFL